MCGNTNAIRRPRMMRITVNSALLKGDCTTEMSITHKEDIKDLERAMSGAHVHQDEVRDWITCHPDRPSSCK